MTSLSSWISVRERRDLVGCLGTSIWAVKNNTVVMSWDKRKVDPLYYLDDSLLGGIRQGGAFTMLIA